MTRYKGIGIVLLSCSIAAFAAAPIIPWVPLLLDQVIAYLYPKNQTQPYPDTPHVKQLLSAKHTFVCQAKILVTTPTTVSFYREKKNFANYLGITRVGQWLQNNRMCIDNQSLIAITWDAHGKPKAYHSLKKVSNINQQLSLTFPDDFSAPKRHASVICQALVLNNSALPIAIYAEKIATDTQVALMKPYEKRQLVAPCFKNKPLFAVYVNQNQDMLTLHYFDSVKTFNDINRIPLIEFPRYFKSQGQKQITLKPDLLQLLYALL